MRRVATTRSNHVDLLRRRPVLDPVPVAPPPGAVRRVAQLRELLGLVDRGVLSAEELESQQEKVFRPGHLPGRLPGQ